MPVWNSGKLFQVRPVNEKTKFVGKGYSGIGPAKRAITANHNYALKSKLQCEKVLQDMANGKFMGTKSKDYMDRLRYNVYENPWLDPANFEIIEFAIVEKVVHKYP